ncbi:MAG: site-specific DNA-methyltransferase, partial [archaeon]|nr:site-specific DNA-methyltransferase [archaeon]
PEGQHWSLKQEKVDRILAEYHLRLRCKNKNCKTLYYQDESDASLFRNMKKKKHRFKFYDITAEKNVHGLKKLEKCIECGGEEFRVDYLGSPVKKLSNIWTDLESYSKNNNYPTENSELLLERIIKVGSNLGDIVLDCFAGSGTTGAVAEKLGRRWIMADFGELSIEIIQKRMLSLKEKIGNKGKKLLPIKSFTLFLPKN